MLACAIALLTPCLSSCSSAQSVGAPAGMTLDLKPWTWVRATYNDGRELVPRQVDAFTLTFRADGVFSGTTDCNRLTGGYAVGARELAFRNVAATRMFCQDSQEQAFTELLGNVSSYSFTPEGDLVLELDSGSAIFR